jgi:acetyl-CoA carboxylase alpha subunit
MSFHPVVDEWDVGLTAGDPLGFPGYAERLDDAGGQESVRTGRTAQYAFVESLFDVHGGTMGLVAGEKVVRAYDRAVGLRLPMVVAARTGGARVQEGMLALVQLARTAAAAHRHAEAGLLSLAIYGSPTTGGVFASYASLADLRAAHPNATVGFAGPRVAESALGTSLPPGSHTARSLYDQGLLDALIAPGEEAGWIELALGSRWRPLPSRPLPAIERFDEHGAWGEVLRSRSVGRPSGVDWAARLCSSWAELRGTDPVVRAGLATLAVDGTRCLVVATDRYQGAGRPTPAGFRLAQRAVGLAGRLEFPVLTLVDTPGADPSPESELDGLGVEIARTLALFAACPTPVISICVGEGGSGGALALACGDRLLMTRHAIFSVIGPEGAASIVLRDADRAPELAEQLRLTAADQEQLGIADEVLPEDKEALAAAVVQGLATAKVGDRLRRFDAATARWIH